MVKNRFIASLLPLFLLLVFSVFIPCSCGGGHPAATSPTYSISGRVTSGGSGLSGVTVTLSGTASATTTTAAAGTYSFTGLANGSYTLTPSLSGYSFTPATANVSVNGANQNMPDFARLLSISGRVTSGGSGLSGVTVTLSGAASATTTTAAAGTYSFTGLANGSYILTPSLSGCSFTPATANVTVNGTNQNMPDFAELIWIWVAGSKIANQAGTYGAATGTTGTPGSRDGSVSWSDSSGNRWLFGGFGWDSTGTQGFLNDLWKFNGTSWTWVAGSNNTNQAGTYGAATGTTGTPGSRDGSVSWTDSSGNLWLFGGNGWDSTGTQGFLNDLWKFNGTSWTWVAGSKTANQVGTYGASTGTTGTPTSRYTSVSWSDSSGNLWLFGGFGYDSTGNLGILNDLWKFNGTSWTWVAGSKTANQPGAYGAATGTTGTPGSRNGSVSWSDSSGNLWLFGGIGDDSTGTTGGLNDLWKFNGTNWIWVAGSKTANQAGTYGAVTGTTGTPGSRDGSVSWTDSSGNLWLFGGIGYDSTGTTGGLNDLWKFNGTNWIWVAGSKTANQAGTYGAVTGTTGTPGSREFSVSWSDSSGNLWLFGGIGDDSTGSGGFLNDLWKFGP